MTAELPPAAHGDGSTCSVPAHAPARLAIRTCAALTRAGARTLSACERDAARLEASLLAALSPAERETLRALLERVLPG